MSEIIGILKSLGVGVDTLMLVAIVWRMSQIGERFRSLEKTVCEHSEELWGNGKEGLKIKVARIEERLSSHGEHQ